MCGPEDFPWPPSLQVWGAGEGSIFAKFGDLSGARCGAANSYDIRAEKRLIFSANNSATTSIDEIFESFQQSAAYLLLIST